MQSFITKFPESDKVLALYYALQENGLPCIVVRADEPDEILVSPNNLPMDEMAKLQYFATIKGFILGWNACYYREALLPDKSLQPNPGCIVP